MLAELNVNDMVLHACRTKTQTTVQQQRRSSKIYQKHTRCAVRQAATSAPKQQEQQQQNQCFVAGNSSTCLMHQFVSPGMTFTALKSAIVAAKHARAQLL